MYLSKNGVTVEVTHPSDIRRYKSLGYAEDPKPEAVEPEVVKPEAKKPKVKKAAEVSGEKDGE